MRTGAEKEKDHNPSRSRSRPACRERGHREKHTPRTEKAADKAKLRRAVLSPAPQGAQPPPFALGALAQAPPPQEPAVQLVPMTTSMPKVVFPAKKWTVACADTVVRTTEQLNSPEVLVLQKGEIVEQVAPALRLPSGVLRIQIRHPSSPQFPHPIGWVTLDATPIGGPRLLVAGPVPMAERFRPRRPPGSHAPTAPGASGPRSKCVFPNLKWVAPGARF